jgi:hypothetical protein
MLSSASQWLIAQLVELSLSVMKDPGSNLGEDICSFRYSSINAGAHKLDDQNS